MNCPACNADNPPFHKYCRECGGALSGMPIGEDERRVVTVLFADMSGSTALGEQMDPEKVKELMDEFVQELAACVHRYGGTVDKFMGDGIMANFGAPRAHEDDPERALASALEMREGLRALNQRFAAILPTQIGIHIGVNTGLVVAGRVGSRQRGDYTVLGDSVNLAARLEDKSEDGQILISEQTYQLTNHAFKFNPLPPVMVKGKAEPVNVYELVGRRARPTNRRGVPGFHAGLIGRDAELARIGEAVARLERGNGGYLSVTGPAGVGKTRLLREARLAAALRKVKWVEAACTSLGLGGALGIWVEIIRRLLGVDDSRARRTGPLPRLTVNIPAGGTRILSLEEVRDASHSLAGLLKLDGIEGGRAVAGSDGLRDRIAAAVREVIETEAATQPLVLQLDDLHWADSASLTLLGRVLESTSRAPLLVIASFRNDADTVRLPLADSVARAAPPFKVEIDLHALSPADSAALAEALVPGESEDLEDVRRLLVENSGGNPLFLEEVLRSLREQGVLQERPTGGLIVTQEPRTVEVPETLRGLLLDRIDRLPESSKRMAQIAAVVGRSFPSALLEDIAGASADVPALLSALVQDGVLEAANPPDALGADYRFQHALMQEAAYASLLHRHRRPYHQRVAEWYERQFDVPEPPAELPLVLAHHYERAESWNQAAHWAGVAADDARSAFALAEARDLYNRAIQFAEKAGAAGIRRAALAGLGEVALAEGLTETALERFAAALDITVDPLERALLERRGGQALDQAGQPAAAIAAFSRAATALGDEREGEPPEAVAERARLRVARAFAHLNRGDDASALFTAEVALRADLPPADRADVTALLGAIHLRRGDAEQARDEFETALELARSLGDLVREAAILEQLARTNRLAGRRAAARGDLDEALRIRARLRDERGAATAQTELAALDEAEGDLPRAARRLEEAVERAAACDEPVIAARAWLKLGRILRMQGMWDAARSALERAGNDDPEMAGRAAFEVLLLDVAMRREPEGALLQAIQEGERHGVAEMAANARLALATIYRRRGQRDQARLLLREILTGPGRMDRELAAAARTTLTELAIDEGNAEVSVTSARLSLEAAERAGAAHLVWRARRLLAVALGVAGEQQEAEDTFRLATEETRAAGALPELARGLNQWTALRAAAGVPPSDPESTRLLEELSAVLERLGGRPLPAHMTTARLVNG